MMMMYEYFPKSDLNDRMFNSKESRTEMNFNGIICIYTFLIQILNRS